MAKHSWFDTKEYNASTHWFIGTNKFGQQMRMCNSFVTGIFVSKNDDTHQHEVTCKECKKHLIDPEKLAKKQFEFDKYRLFWG